MYGQSKWRCHDRSYDGAFGQAWVIQSGSSSRLRRSETDGLY